MLTAKLTSCEALPGMRKSLKFALMARPAIATLLSLTPSVWAATNPSITPTTDEGGHKVYVNDVVSQPKAPAQGFRSQENHLVFWSSTERRWKTVPHANVQAAESAAAEVDQYPEKPTA